MHAVAATKQRRLERLVRQQVEVLCQSASRPPGYRVLCRALPQDRPHSQPGQKLHKRQYHVRYAGVRQQVEVLCQSASRPPGYRVLCRALPQDRPHSQPGQKLHKRQYHVRYAGVH